MPKKKKASKKKAVKKKTAKKKAVKRKAASSKKKAAWKKPSKATAKPKTVVRVKVSSKILGEAPIEHEFVLGDGRRLKTIYELVDALGSMNDDLFSAHVNSEKNDFCNWLRDVFDEKKFAKDMQKIKDRIKLQRQLMKRVVDIARNAKG
jgi:hypothetical protein